MGPTIRVTNIKSETRYDMKRTKGKYDPYIVFMYDAEVTSSDGTKMSVPITGYYDPVAITEEDGKYKIRPCSVFGLRVDGPKIEFAEHSSGHGWVSEYWENARCNSFTKESDIHSITRLAEDRHDAKFCTNTYSDLSKDSNELEDLSDPEVYHVTITNSIKEVIYWINHHFDECTLVANTPSIILTRDTQIAIRRAYGIVADLKDISIDMLSWPGYFDFELNFLKVHTLTDKDLTTLLSKLESLSR